MTSRLAVVTLLRDHLNKGHNTYNLSIKEKLCNPTESYQYNFTSYKRQPPYAVKLHQISQRVHHVEVTLYISISSFIIDGTNLCVHTYNSSVCSLLDSTFWFGFWLCTSNNKNAPPIHYHIIYVFVFAWARTNAKLYKAKRCLIPSVDARLQQYKK